MADTTPLAEVIAKYADQKMFDAIAREYDKGRLLLIGTTDLDAQRPVIWNIGALAASGHPKALDLFRKILRASAAIPGAFQPVLIDVEIDGKKYQEMHVDGGAIAQLFLYPPTIEVGRIGVPRARVAYVIRNARLDPDYAKTERRTITIAGRAIATMLAASGHNDVLRTYFVTPARRRRLQPGLHRHGFHPPTKPGEFDQAYMQALLRLRLPRGQGWPGLAQGAARAQGGKGPAGRRRRISGRSAGRAYAVTAPGQACAAPETWSRPVAARCPARPGRSDRDVRRGGSRSPAWGWSRSVP